jgi:hypothetical protein
LLINDKETPVINFQAIFIVAYLVNQVRFLLVIMIELSDQLKYMIIIEDGGHYGAKQEGPCKKCMRAAVYFFLDDHPA